MHNVTLHPESSDYGVLTGYMRFGACDHQKCVDINIVDDQAEEKTEAFELTLERTSGLDDRIILTPVNAFIEIRDNDGNYINNIAVCIIIMFTTNHRGCGGSAENILHSERGQWHGRGVSFGA